MPDVFSRTVEWGNAFSSDGAVIRISDSGGNAITETGFLSQKLTWQYGQQITRLHELESPKVYLFAGRTQGRASLDTILGARRLLTSFYRQFGDVCNAEDNVISFDATVGCGDDTRGSSATITLHHCVIDQLGGAVAAENMIVQNTISLQFIKMTMTDGGSSPPGAPGTPGAPPDDARGGPLLDARFGLLPDAAIV